MPVTLNKRIFIFIAIIIALSGIVFSLVINLYKPLPEDFVYELKLKTIDKPNLRIMLENLNLTKIVVDCSQLRNSYDVGNRIPLAIWSKEPSMFYNNRLPVVVYSDNDTNTKMFCIEILKHQKYNATVLMFRGGFLKWSEEEI